MDPTAGAFVAAMPKKQRASVRVDPELSHSIDTDGALGRCGFEEDSLVFRYRRQVVARIDGPKPKLMLLAELCEGETKLMPADLLSTEVPRDIGAFHVAVDQARAEVETLLTAGRVLVEAAERLVCALYGIPADLEDEVVAHAVARAEANMAASD